ncbi:MAG: hypothetical protein U0946_01635 [Patescibacteria group bacterium]|nr:hypothetical protein [Patescibacteria group bacterium]
MPRLLKIFILVFSFSFLIFRFYTPVSAQTNSCICPSSELQKMNTLGMQWLPYPPPFAPTDYSQFYIPWIKSNYTAKDKFLQKNVSILPNPESVGCLIAYANKFWTGSKFTSQYVDKVINFAINNNWNPSLLLSFWLEESHAGQTTPIEFGCGSAIGFDAQLNCLANSVKPIIKDNNFHCFLCGYANYHDCPVVNDCGWSSEGQSNITNFPAFIQFYNYLTLGTSSSSPGKLCSSNTTSPSTVLPLRPNPFELVKEEKDRQISDPNLAPFCAYRPTIVQNTPIDKRQKNITIQGTLNTDFRSFTTPFLSAPGGSVGDQRYLADYLEADVFQKLAPASYQDQLKNAMIQRASGSAAADAINQTYGFPTATTQIHDYELNTPYGKFKLSQLEPKPLDNPETLALWQNSPTAQVWPYIPMFTREDTKGFIQSLPEPGQTSSPQVTEVIHPHLARTYEVSSTIANMLSPESTHQFQKPDLPINWVEPPPWTTDSHWLDSSQSVPPIFGPVCEPQSPTKIIAGPGDLAQNQKISTAVFKQFDNPLYDPSCIFNGNIFNCFTTQEYRFSPIYLKTYTPFLDQIAFNLLTGPGALFGIFNSTNEKPANWPAVGNDSQKAPAYSFSAGQAESGFKKTARPAQYLYNYLGTLHCQKEQLIATLQPFLTGTTYNLPPECEGTTPAPATALDPGSTASTPNTPTDPGDTTISETTLSCANTTNIWIYQSNPAWSNILSPADQNAEDPQYPQCTIGLSGCGSVAVAEILKAFGNTDGVVKVWNHQHEIGGYVYGIGQNTDGSENKFCLTVHEGAMQILQEASLSTAYIGGNTDADWQEAETYLDNCGLIYATGVASWKNSNPSAHVLVITGIMKNSQGKVVAVKTIDGATIAGNGLVRIIMDYIPIDYRGEFAYDVVNLFAVTK